MTGFEPVTSALKTTIFPLKLHPFFIKNKNVRVAGVEPAAKAPKAFMFPLHHTLFHKKKTYV